MYPAGSSRTDWKRASAAIEVMNVMMNSTPNMRAFLWSSAIAIPFERRESGDLGDFTKTCADRAWSRPSTRQRPLLFAGSRASMIGLLVVAEELPEAAQSRYLISVS